MGGVWKGRSPMLGTMSDEPLEPGGDSVLSGDVGGVLGEEESIRKTGKKK